MAESNFKKLQQKMERKEGYSPKVAAEATAAAGRRSIGQAEMTKGSVEGRKSAAKKK